MLTRASLYFSEGHLDFEKNWLPRFIGKGNTRLVNTSEGITLITGHHHDHGHHETGADPHVWLSAQCVKKQVENIADVLMEQDSSNASYYDANRQKLLHIIDSVDQTIQGILSDHRGKSFLIFHPALGYFARDYGLEQVSIEEEGKEPTAARIAELIDLCRKKGIKSIFIQKEFDARNAEAIAKEVNARLIVIDPMAYNWPVNMIGLAKTIAEN
jgi:zinc transport system substrate-binding protein